MSWGEPQEIRKMPGQNNAEQNNGEQWVYAPDALLTLKNGVLDSVSNQSVPAK